MAAYDVAIVGAGAAGMLCAAVAAARGRRVVLVDHRQAIGEKIRISGGGRCNFTNLETTPAQFQSDQPGFCRAALEAFTPGDFLKLVRAHRIGYHEKHRGQLFCDESAQSIVRMLVAECDRSGVVWRLGAPVAAVRAAAGGYVLDAPGGTLTAAKLVIATGGLSIPKIGATDFAFRVARQFDVPVVPPRPGLVPLTFAPPDWAAFASLTGISLPVRGATARGARRGAIEFEEDLLFTHRGLSGPAVLQLSTFWSAGESLVFDLAPGQDVAAALLAGKDGTRRSLVTALAAFVPRRLAEAWPAAAAARERNIAELKSNLIEKIGKSVNNWQITPNGTLGYGKAEVTAGGVDTRALRADTLESLGRPGLHFIGECVDVTGWLGGYNFQWAWASAVACGRAV